MSGHADAPIRALLLWIALVNTLSAVAVITFVVMAGLGTIKGLQVGTDAGFTQENLKALMEDVLHTASNVRNATANTVPIMQTARKGVQQTNWTEAGRGVVNATKHVPTVTRKQFGEFLGNVTQMFGSLAKANYSAVTSAISDLHDPAVQSTIRQRVDHALRSFDYASFGAGDLLKTLGETLSSHYRGAPKS